MISMTGRVTMLGISRWGGKGCSYRTVQRFYNSLIHWPKLFSSLFHENLYDEEHEYIVAGDECVGTKSGTKTHGVDYFFSGLFNKVVKGFAIFTLSLVSVEAEESYPLQVEQVIRTEEEKKAAKKKKAKKKEKKNQDVKRKPGRPKGSKNKDKTKVELTPEFQQIQGMLNKQVKTFKLLGIKVKHFVGDGHFGINSAVQMVHQTGLFLVSKLQYNSALIYPYEGTQKNKGPKKKYGKKIDYQNIPKKYKVAEKVEKGVKTCTYHLTMLHKLFSQKLNVVIITKTKLKTGKFANVILFTTDLSLPFEKIIKFYRLRFQIEFNFRDAKQFWGLEDFMNTKEVPVTNAINLSLFMVLLSKVLLRDFRQSHPNSGILDLKAYFRALKYLEKTIKMLPEKPDPILLEQVLNHVSSLGCIHS